MRRMISQFAMSAVAPLAMMILISGVACSEDQTESTAQTAEKSAQPAAPQAAPQASKPAQQTAQQTAQQPTQQPAPQPAQASVPRQASPSPSQEWGEQEALVIEDEALRKAMAENMIYATIRIKMEDMIEQRSALLKSGRHPTDVEVRQLEGSIMRARELLMEAGEMVEDIVPPIVESTPRE